MVKRVFLFLTLLSWVDQLSIAAAYRSKARAVGEESVQFDMGVSLFKTQAYRDINGAEITKFSEENFQKMDVDFLGTYGYSKNFDVFIGGRFRENQSDYYDDRDDLTSPLRSASSSGFESYIFGAKYFFNSDKNWNIGTGLSFRQTSYSNEIYDVNSPPSEIILGDDSAVIQMGLFVAPKRRSTYNFESSLIFSLPNKGRSKEIEYDFAGIYNGNKWSVLGGLAGIISLKTDEYTKNPEDKPPVYTGATFQYNSTNPSYYAPYVQVNFSVTKNWTFRFKVAKRLNGVSTDEGDEYSIGINWQQFHDKRKKKLIKKFKEYNIEASVIKVSPRGIFLTVDKGISDELKVGQKIDVYQFDYLGGNKIVAQGIVYEVKAETAIVRILKKLRNIPIKVGFVVRAE